MKKLEPLTWSIFILTALTIISCGGKPAPTVMIDGSSTVFPINEAIAEEFQKENKGIRVTVGVSGTGGGFKKFATGEIDITGGSRPIKQSENRQCQENGIEYIEIPVAYDGLAVIVNPQNDWSSSMTVKELKMLWEPEAQGKITKWSQVRKGWPDENIRLYGAGADSGTYDYFTQAIVGKEHSSRGDFTASEDDNILVQGVAGDKFALGFFGLAYYEENMDKLKLVGIDNGKGPVAPSLETVKNGTYQPLSRPLFIYINKKSLEEKPEVQNFVNYYIKHAGTLSRQVGYIPLPENVYTLVEKRIANRTAGTLFTDGSKVGITVEELLKK